MDIYDGRDPREIAAYIVPDAARFVGVPASTVRDWTSGLELPQPRYLSFLNLVEIHVLSSLRRQHHVSPARIRSALEYTRNRLGISHPLAHVEFVTDGVDLFLDHSGAFLNASMEGQVALKKLLEVSLRRIERDDQGVAARFFPFSRVNREESPMFVVIDPRVNFGRPVIRGRGVPTRTVAELHRAGDSVIQLRDDFGCPLEAIEEALRYERAAA